MKIKWETDENHIMSERKTRKNRHTPEKDQENYVHMWGDGTTESAIRKKRVNNITRMNKGNYVSEEILIKYGITMSDVTDVSKIHADVLKKLKN